MAEPYYKKEQIDHLKNRYIEVNNQYDSLHSEIVSRRFSTPKGDEFAKHGFLRRTNMIQRCIQNIFDIMPPDLDSIPDRNKIQDATLFLHSFMIHIFGACDDLAWILVHERQITKLDGKQLPSAWIGFRKDNKLVRDKLSQAMIDALNSFEEWFDHVDDFRHSLAHRIPLYIPPFCVSADKKEEYERLENESWNALVQGKLDKHKQFLKEQSELKFFRPFFTHSFSENAPHMVVHPQILADFSAVIVLGEATMKEISAHPPFCPE